jgi:hypothetical protein
MFSALHTMCTCAPSHPHTIGILIEHVARRFTPRHESACGPGGVFLPCARVAGRCFGLATGRRRLAGARFRTSGHAARPRPVSRGATLRTLRARGRARGSRVVVVGYSCAGDKSCRNHCFGDSALSHSRACVSGEGNCRLDHNIYAGVQKKVLLAARSALCPRTPASL